MCGRGARELALDEKVSVGPVGRGGRKGGGEGLDALLWVV